MSLDLLKLPASEAERLAYAEGFTMAAELFARIDELQNALRTVVYAHNKGHDLEPIIHELERLSK